MHLVRGRGLSIDPHFHDDLTRWLNQLFAASHQNGSPWRKRIWRENSAKKYCSLFISEILFHLKKIFWAMIIPVPFCRVSTYPCPNYPLVFARTLSSPFDAIWIAHKPDIKPMMGEYIPHGRGIFPLGPCAEKVGRLAWRSNKNCCCCFVLAAIQF